MSNFLAIATVTETLRYILDGAVGRDVTGAVARAVSPTSPSTALPGVGVNIFLYHVAHNPGWRNADLPTRRGDGDPTRRPCAALDLSYLFSFYGDSAEQEPQRVMGSTIKTLHTNPILPRRKIREVIDAAISTNPNHYLSDANLDEAVELVKITPNPLNLEDMSRLWSMFTQTAYVLSTTYLVSAVFIEADTRPQEALPVQTRNVYALPFRQPHIERVKSAAGADAPVVSGAALVITGERLRGETTQIRFSTLETLTIPIAVSDTEIRVTVPPALRAGVHGVQVVHLLNIGTPPLPHRGFESNLVPMVLHPQITASVGGVTSTTVNGVTLRSGEVTVNFTPPVREGQRVTLMLNEFQTAPTTDANAYSFPAPGWSMVAVPDSGEVNSMVFEFDRVLPGAYLVRVQVDGADSVLTAGADGRFNAPQVTI